MTVCTIILSLVSCVIDPSTKVSPAPRRRASWRPISSSTPTGATKGRADGDDQAGLDTAGLQSADVSPHARILCAALSVSVLSIGGTLVSWRLCRPI
jgi:hypothetical protein